MPQLPTFWLQFSITGDPTAWIPENLPIPNAIQITAYGALIAWQVEGYFSTQKGIEYLNDTIAKISIALQESKPKRLPWKPDTKAADHYYAKIYKLKAFNDLPGVRKRTKAPNRADSFDDYAFWAIKLWTEDQIREQGEGSPIVYAALEDWALSQFIDKERSTIRAKCRSVWKWYEERNWTTGRKFEMTRSERAKANSQKKADEAKRKVINATSGLMAEEYKTKTGKWNISKLAKELKMSRDTVRKYLPNNEE